MTLSGWHLRLARSCLCDMKNAPPTQKNLARQEMRLRVNLRIILYLLPFTSRLYHSRHQRTQAGLKTSVRSSLFRQTVLHDIGQPTSKRYYLLLTYPIHFYLFKMNYSITRFTGIDYSNKSARWDLVAERHTQESALATCKSLNLNRPFYHRVEVNSKRVELPRFTVLKPNMKSNYEPIVIPASFTVRKKYNFFQKLIRRFF